jgi:uncharacterized protein (DUF1499 family)
MKHPVHPILLIVLMTLIGCTQTAPRTTGLKDGRLLPCPDNPNCVCSQDPSERHRIEPLRYAGTQAHTRERLLEAMKARLEQTQQQIDGLVTQSLKDYFDPALRKVFRGKRKARQVRLTFEVEQLDLPGR